MDKIWFIYIDGQKQGPYSLADLKRDSRITPDTLVWKPGFKDWTPIRNVVELKSLFEDETQEKEEEPEETLVKKKPKKLPHDEVIALRSEPPYTYFWLIIAVLLILLYVFFQLYK